MKKINWGNIKENLTLNLSLKHKAFLLKVENLQQNTSYIINLQSVH